MGFKYYEQNQLMIPMEWKTLNEGLEMQQTEKEKAKERILHLCI